MWNTVSIVFCVILVLVSILFLPFSVACLLLLSTSGLVLLHELQWDVNLSQLQIWMNSCIEYFMDKKSSKSKPSSRVLNSNGISKPHSSLMTNKITASPNLTPQSKFVNEPIVSDIFKMSLNDSNRHSTPISVRGSSGKYKYDLADDERNSWSNKSNEAQSMSTQKNIQTVAGPLLVSTRFNSNISSEMSANASSAGFSSRLAQKGAEMAVTHQAKYTGIGVFPVVQLQSRSPRVPLSATRATPVSAKAVRVRIAPPDQTISPLSVGNGGGGGGGMNSSDLSNMAEGEESVKSVLQVLKEISRKRIHSQVDEDGDETVKRPKKDRIEENLTKSLDPTVQNKRGREDSPRSSEEVKRQRRHLNGTTTTTTRSNEIMSSLSSSLAVKPPHLLHNANTTKATKRKAHAVDWSRCSTPVSGKVLKVNTSPLNQDQANQAAAARSAKYQDGGDVERVKVTKHERDGEEDGGGKLVTSQQQTPSWSGESGVVRIEAGQRRLLARGGGGVQDKNRGAVEGGHIVRVVQPDDGGAGGGTVVVATPPVATPTSRLLKQMADPGGRLKDMLAAINGGDDVSTEEATMSPNVVAILKSAKSSSGPANDSTSAETVAGSAATNTLSILKTLNHSDAHKTVSFAKPLATFAELPDASSDPATSLSTATVVSTSLNNYISSAEVVTTVVNKVSPFTLPSASPNATSKTTATPSKPFPADAMKSSASPSTVFSLFASKQEDKSPQQQQQINTPVGFAASAFNSNAAGEENKGATKQDSSPAKSLFGMPKDVSSVNSTSFAGNSPALNLLGGGNSTASTPVASSAPTFSFGAKPADPSTASPFGANPADLSTSSAFAVKPADSSAASPFGAKPADLSTTSPFGTNLVNTPTTLSSLFGAGNATASTPTSSSSFSMSNSEVKSNESRASTSNTDAAAAAAAPSLFGNSATPPGTASPYFGGSSSASSAGTATVQLFGGASSSSASSSATTTTTPAFNLFGVKTSSDANKSSVPSTTAAAASSMFGGTSSGSPAFGSTTTTTTSGSIFGAAANSVTSFGGGTFGTFGSASTTPTTFGSSDTSRSTPKTNAFSSSSATPVFGAVSSLASAPVTTATGFGGGGGAAASSNAFSSGQATNFSTASAAPAFGAFASSPSAFGSKPATASTAAAQPSAFSQPSSSMFSFGSSSHTPAAAAAAAAAQSSSLFNGVAATSSAASNGGGFGVGFTSAGAQDDKAKSGGFGGGGSFQPAAAAAPPAFAFGAASGGGGGGGGAFAFGANNNSSAPTGGGVQTTQSAVSAFSFSKSSSSATEPSKPFGFGGGSTMAPAPPAVTANQQSAFTFNSSSGSVATPSTGFQFSAASSSSTVQPQVPGAFVFGGAGGASSSNSAFGVNPPAFTLGAGGGGGVGGPGSPAGARFSIGSGSTSARSRSVARAKRTK